MIDFIVILIAPFIGVLLGYIVSLIPPLKDFLEFLSKQFKPVKYLFIMASVFVSMMWIIYTQLFLEYIKHSLECKNIFYLSLFENGVINVLWFYFSICIYRKIMDLSVKYAKSFKVDISQINSEHDFNSIINSSLLVIMIFFLLSKEYIYFGIFTAYLLSAIFDYNKKIRVKDISNFFTKRNDGNYYCKSTIFIEIICGIISISYAFTI